MSDRLLSSIRRIETLYILPAHHYPTGDRLLSSIRRIETVNYVIRGKFKELGDRLLSSIRRIETG